MFTNNHSCDPLLSIRAQEGRILYSHGITEYARNYFVKSLKYIMIDYTVLMPTDNFLSAEDEAVLSTET